MFDLLLGIYGILLLWITFRVMGPWIYDALYAENVSTAAQVRKAVGVIHYFIAPVGAGLIVANFRPPVSTLDWIVAGLLYAWLTSHFLANGMLGMKRSFTASIVFATLWLAIVLLTVYIAGRFQE